MFSLTERTMSIASTCINVCRMTPDTGYCEGCLRTIPEITEWSRATDERKHAILAAVARRKAEAEANMFGDA